MRIGKHEYMIIDPVTTDAFKRGECFTKAYKPKKGDEEDHDKINESPVQSNSLKRKLPDTVRTPFVSPFKLPKTEEEEEEPDLSCFEISIFRLPANKCQSIEESQEVVEVDWELTKCLRDYQREGIEFMYKCIMGFYERIEVPPKNKVIY